MPDYDLRLGERLEIIYNDWRGVSDIQEITPQGRLIISEPMRGEGRLPVKQNDTLRLFYYRDFGLLSCIVTAERIFIKDGLMFIEAELRSRVTRYQRRDFVRFETVLPLTVMPLAQNTEGLSDEMTARMLLDRRVSGISERLEPDSGCFTLDISGGGLRFLSKRQYESGTAAETVISLDNEDSVDADIRIVRAETDPADRNRFMMGARFIGIEESVRSRIIRYIFEEQIKRRKNDLPDQGPRS